MKRKETTVTILELDGYDQEQLRANYLVDSDITLGGVAIHSTLHRKKTAAEKQALKLKKQLEREGYAVEMTEAAQ